jgi:hypothetical protein
MASKRTRAAVRRYILSAFTLLTATASLCASGTEGFALFGGPKLRGWAESDPAMVFGLLVQAPSAPVQRYKPIHVVVLIDASRWMEGAPLQYARRAAQRVIGGLKDGDYFGLMTYTSTAATNFPLQPVLRERSSVLASVDRIRAGGERDLLSGINGAVTELNRLGNQATVGRYLFIMTNGDPTTGLTAPDNLLQKARQICAQNDITISTFAFKQEQRDFNEDLLMDLAYQTGGRAFLAHVQDSSTANAYYETQRICFPSVHKVSLAIDPPLGSSLARVRGGFLDGNKIMLGDMEPGGFRIVLFDFAGRPVRSGDFGITTSFRPGDPDIREKFQNLGTIKLSPSAQDLNPEFAPFILFLEFQSFLFDNAGSLIGNRRDFSSRYRDQKYELERAKNQMASGIFNYFLRSLTQYEGIINNTAIDDDLTEKLVKYQAMKLFYGQ